MDKAQEFATMAQEEVSEGDFKTATKLFTKAINHNNNNFKLYLDRALCNQKLGNHRESLDDCEAAVKLDNRNYQCHYQKACALANTAQMSQAETSFKKAIELQTAQENTTLIDIYTLLCNALVKLNQFSHIKEAHYNINGNSTNTNLGDNNYSHVNGVNNNNSNNNTNINNKQDDNIAPTAIITRGKRSNSCQVFGANEDIHRANDKTAINSKSSHHSFPVNLLSYDTAKKTEESNTITNPQSTSIINDSERLSHVDLQRHNLFNQVIPQQQQINYVSEPMRYGLDYNSSLDIYGHNKLLSHQRAGHQQYASFFDAAPYSLDENEPLTYGPIGPHLNKQMASNCSKTNKVYNNNGEKIDDARSRMDLPAHRDSRIKSKSVSGDMMSSTETLTSRDKVNIDNNHGSLLGQSSVDSGLSISQDGNESIISSQTLSRLAVNTDTDKSRNEDSAKLYNYESEWLFGDVAKIRAMSSHTQNMAQIDGSPSKKGNPSSAMNKTKVNDSISPRHHKQTEKSNLTQELRQNEERSRKSYANVIDGGGKFKVVNGPECDISGSIDKNNNSNFNHQIFIEKRAIRDDSESNKIEYQSYISTFASKDTSIASYSSGYDSKLDSDGKNLHPIEDRKLVAKDEDCDFTKATDSILANSMKNKPINQVHKTYNDKADLTNAQKSSNKSQVNMRATNVMGYKSLWIGSISPRCKKNTLEKVFARYGKITSIHLLSGRLSSIGTISAFVNFDNSESPINAICELRNKYIAYACVDKKSPLQFRLTPDDQHKKTLNKNDAKVRTAQLGECFYWRNYTRGCLRGDDCEFYHIPMNRAIDNPPWLLELTSPANNTKTI